MVLPQVGWTLESHLDPFVKALENKGDVSVNRSRHDTA
jgi:hypothetical protein